MKKILLTIVITLSLYSEMSAQQYYPMLDSVNRWTYSVWNCFARPHPMKSYSPCSYPLHDMFCIPEIYTGQDTVIDSITYKTVIVGDSTNPCLYGFIREDTAAKKVYFRDVLSNPEFVLYNFSMQVGDTIPINFYVNGYFPSGRYRLDSIGSINILAGSRRVFYLHCDTCQNPRQLTWVESVGFLGDAIYPYSQNMMGCLYFCQELDQGFYQQMNCFEHVGKVYFDSCLHQHISEQLIMNPFCTYYVDSCHYCNTCGGGIPEISSVSSFEISPNPSNGKINIAMTISQTDDFEIYIIDITGKQVLNKFSFGRLAKGITNRNLDISNLNQGFYILECRGTNGSLFRKLIIQK